MLTLEEARKTGRLQEFIAQAEAAGVGPIPEADFNATAEAVIRTPQPDDQTSGSPRRGGSPEK